MPQLSVFTLARVRSIVVVQVNPAKDAKVVMSSELVAQTSSSGWSEVRVWGAVDSDPGPEGTTAVEWGSGALDELVVTFLFLEEMSEIFVAGDGGGFGLGAVRSPSINLIFFAGPGGQRGFLVLGADMFDKNEFALRS
jgi:hypothetical protein